MWFEQLTGFAEESPNQVRANLDLGKTSMTSRVNGRQMTFGRLETPTLAELRRRVANSRVGTGRLDLAETVADVQTLHMAEDSAGALFQVASQFNLLEMIGPSVTPEEGVAIYANDPTQGPACAIASEVTINEGGSLVSQAYCSALPVAYSLHASDLWQLFATLVLEAAYESTLSAAVLNYASTGNNTVYLTQLGGGAFGNEFSWIERAIERACTLFSNYPLAVRIVSYGAPDFRLERLLSSDTQRS